MFNIAVMPDMFAARNTTQPALIDPLSGLTRTYGQLAERTDQLAGALFDVEFMNELPMTPTGKVNRSLLK